MKTVNGWVFVDDEKNTGTRNADHADRNTMIPTAATAGPRSGSTMCHRRRASFAPSSRAAEFDIERKRGHEASHDPQGERQ